MKCAALVVVASLALVAQGCGGDDDSGSGTVTPIAEWAAGLCTAISTWTEALQAAGEPLRTPATLSRVKIEQAGQEMRAVSATFEQELDALGAPDVEAGDEARAAIEDFEGKLDARLAEIDEAVDDASGTTSLPDAVKGIVAALTWLRRGFENMLAEIGTSRSGEELQEAFDATGSCKSGND